MDPYLGRVYLAARFSRADEMRGVRDFLKTAFEVPVTSRWIDLHPDVVGTPQQTASATPEALNADPAAVSTFGQADIDDLRAADTLVSFSSGDGANGKGGRHVEFGMGLALGHRMILIGRRENVFHTLPVVEQYDTWSAFVEALASARTLTAALTGGA